MRGRSVTLDGSTRSCLLRFTPLSLQTTMNLEFWRLLLRNRAVTGRDTSADNIILKLARISNPTPFIFGQRNKKPRHNTTMLGSQLQADPLCSHTSIACLWLLLWIASPSAWRMPTQAPNAGSFDARVVMNHVWSPCCYYVFDGLL